MARVAEYLPVYPWMGGLNTSVDPMILDPQNLVVADNIVFTTSGTRKKRGGQAHYNSSLIGGSAAENVVHIIDYWANVSNAKREYFVALTQSGKAYRSPFNGTWSSFSTLTLAVSQGGVTHTTQNEDLIIGIKGSGVPKVWQDQNTSTNLVNLTSSSGTLPFTSAWIVTNFIERLFVAGDPSNPDNLYVSKAGDYTKWTQTQTAGGAITLPIGQGDGDPVGITAIFPGNGADRSIYVAKRTKLYRVNCSDSNQVNWSVIPISKEIGVVNHNTVATIDTDDVIFASDRGVHTLGQVVNTTAIIEGQFLSFPIQNDWLNVIDNTSRASMSAVYVSSLNSYLLGCKRVGQTTWETVYGYNVQLKQWFRWTSVPCNHLLRRINVSSGAEELYAAATGGYVNKLQQTALNDFGSAIVTTIKTAFLSPSAIRTSMNPYAAPIRVPLMENQFLNLACIYRAHENSTFTVSYSIDGLTSQVVTYTQRVAGGNTLGTTVLGTGFILGSIQAIKPVWNHLTISEGNSIQLTFTQNGINQDFELYGFVLEYETDEEAQNAFRNPIYGS